MRSSSQYFLRDHHMPGIVLEAWGLLANKPDKQHSLLPCLVNILEVEGQAGRSDNKEKPQQISKSCSMIEGDGCFEKKISG